MVGGILGLLVSWTYLSTSWTGPYSQDNIFDGLYWATFLWMGGTLLLGIFIIPRTIGMMYTPVIFLLPIAFLISLFRHGFAYAFSQVLLGLAGWLITILIGRFRPEST
jgi:hypothetical protein